MVFLVFLISSCYLCMQNQVNWYFFLFFLLSAFGSNKKSKWKYNRKQMSAQNIHCRHYGYTEKLRMNICLKVYLGNFGQVFSLKSYTFWHADCISKHLLLSESDLLYEKQMRQSLPYSLSWGIGKKSKENLVLQISPWIQ